MIKQRIIISIKEKINHFIYYSLNSRYLSLLDFGLDVDEKFLYIQSLRKNNNANYAFKIH